MIDRQIAPASPPFQPFAIKQAKTQFLTNGIPVHLLESGSQPIIRLEFVFRAGSWFEHLNGLAHLSAKMLTEGTYSLSAKEIAETIAVYGAFVEVHQGFEHVNLTLYLMEKHLHNVLPIIADIITAASFPSNELDNLKTIITQNIKVNKEKNQFLASTEFRKTLFGAGHPYGAHYWENDIAQITRENVIDFVKQNFDLGNIEVFISGQFNVDNAIQLLDQYFGGYKKHYPAKEYNKIESVSSVNKKVLIEKTDAMQSSIRVGCHSIARNHPDFIPLLVTNEILGGFFGSRLMKNIREDKGYTYGISSSIQPMVNGAYFAIATDVKRENTQHTLDEIEKEIYNLKTQPVSKDELSTVQSYMLGRYMNSINTPFSLMDKFKTLHYSGLDYQYYENYVKVVQNVTPNDVQIMATKYMDSTTFVQVVVGGLNN